MEWLTAASVMYVVFRLLFTTVSGASYTRGMDEPGGDM